MLADPQSVTYATVAKSLVAVSRGDDSSVYKLNDSGTLYELTINHTFGKRNRVYAKLRRDVYAADPIVPTQNILAGATVSMTIDYPLTGLTATDAQNLAKALRDWAVDATLLKIINGET